MRKINAAALAHEVLRRGPAVEQDDYLVKPFAMARLVARTKALLRRPGAA